MFVVNYHLFGSAVSFTPKLKLQLTNDGLQILID